MKGTGLLLKCISHTATAALLAACASSATVRDGPPPPESCASGEQLVCRATTASQVQDRNGRFCRCRPAPGLP